jgi:hypothetical protein
MTPTICCRHTPEPCLGQPWPLVALPATRTEIDDAQPQADDRCLSIFINNGPRASRSPSMAIEAAPCAKYQEWPFQGFLKRTKIEDNVTYNLEFKLLSISEHFHLLINPVTLNINHNVITYSKIYQVPLKSKKSKVPWIEEEDIKLF